MTFRTRTTVKPTRRRAQHDDTRRALFINLAFGFSIFAAFAVLGGIAFSGYYSAHFVAVGSVNGTTITKDDVSARVAVNLSRYEREITDYGQLRNEGKITSAEYNTVVGGIKQNEDQATMYSDALNQLTQEAMLQEYAAQHGITVTDKQVDDQIVADDRVFDPRGGEARGDCGEPVALFHPQFVQAVHPRLAIGEGGGDGEDRIFVDHRGRARSGDCAAVQFAGADAQVGDFLAALAPPAERLDARPHLQQRQDQAGAQRVHHHAFDHDVGARRD